MPLNIAVSREFVAFRESRTHSRYEEHLVGVGKGLQVAPVLPGAGKRCPIAGQFTIESIEAQSSGKIGMIL